ncbi:MAG: SlyX family protein [Chitinophagales bacterium]|nr:SlyX family protein [Chitinophagales bacterium]
MANNTDRFLIQKGTGNVGIGTSAPNDKVEINSGAAAKSGLRFTQLSAASPTTATPNDFDCNKFPAVDSSGEVILVDRTICGSSSKSDGSDIEHAAQQAQVDALQRQVETLKNEIAEMKAMFSTAPVKSTKMTSSVNNVQLGQIAPNPFSQNATISFSLPLILRMHNC